jgi:hypothetical protein
MSVTPSTWEEKVGVSWFETGSVQKHEILFVKQSKNDYGCGSEW